jgi:hypothetical protein
VPKPAPVPVDPPKQDPPKVEQPKVEQPKAEQPKVEAPAVAAPIARAAAPAVAPLTGRGFSKPKVSGSFRALRVTFTNTSGQAIDVGIAASDAGYAYRAVRRTVAAGQKVTVTLRASKALQRLIRQRARKGKRVRRPAVRVVNLVTNASATVVPRITVR